MKIRQNLLKQILILTAMLFVPIETLVYVLGFDVNAQSVFYYFISVCATIIFLVVLFLVIDKINGRYMMFDDEKIIEKHKRDERIIVYYNQILFTKYHPISIWEFIVSLIGGIADFQFSCAEIVYKIDSKDKEAKRIYLYLSRKNYKRLFAKVL